MKSDIVLVLLFLVAVLIIASAGFIWISPGNTTTTVALCDEIGVPCLSNAECCAGNCIKKRCVDYTCGNGVCDGVEDVVNCKDDCGDKVLLAQWSCKRAGEFIEINYTTANMENDHTIYTRLTYEISTICNETAPSADCKLVYIGQITPETVKLDVNQSKTIITMTESIKQMNVKYPYYNQVPKYYWPRFCVVPFNIETNSTQGALAKCYQMGVNACG
ncbi:MAG: hypothetical protein ABIG30_03480 [Candidatus Aenigmatarchaeota archaeon]